MATVHFMLQGKGGVGKSFVASVLFQYLQKRVPRVLGYDTDPVNRTFAGYTELDVTVLEILEDDCIVPRGFDPMMEAIDELPPEAHVVVDNGASCFVALGAYLKESRAFEMLQGDGHEILIHTLVTGGLAMGDTLAGLRSVFKNFPGVPAVVWLNPYFGEIAIEKQGFYEFKVYEENREAIRAVVEIPPLKADTFGKDLEELMVKRWSFEAAAKSRLPLMTRQRLATTWRNLQKAVDNALFLEAAL
jgi:hypothetical protein